MDVLVGYSHNTFSCCSLDVEGFSWLFEGVFFSPVLIAQIKRESLPSTVETYFINLVSSIFISYVMRRTKTMNMNVKEDDISFPIQRKRK